VRWLFTSGILLLLQVPFAHAETFFDQRGESGELIGFAVPEIRGGISLGIYDEAGKLVRILAVDAEPEEFVKGLNGLIARWDGKMNEGEVAPAGKYFARGVVVGDIKVDGEKFIGNDWGNSTGGLVISRIDDLLVLPDGLLCLGLSADGAGVIVRIGETGKLLGTTDIPGGGEASGPALLAFGPRAEVLVSFRGGLWEFDPESAELKEVTFVKNLSPIVAIGSRVWGFRDGNLVGRAPNEEPVVGPMPDGEIAAWMELGGVLYAGPLSRGLIRLVDGNWENVAGFEDFQFSRFGPESGEGFWGAVPDPAGSGTLLGEFSLKGELVRSLDVGALAIHAVDAAPGGGKVAVTGTESGGTITRLYRRDAEGSWVIETEKSIGETADSHLLAGAPTSSVKVEAIENTLDPGADRTFELRGFVSEQGAYLSTVDGLPLIRISETPDGKAATVEAGVEPGTLRFFVLEDEGGAVFGVSGLDELERIDAGKFDFDGELK